MPFDHCYFIICPDPSENLELQLVGKAYAKSDSSKQEPGKGSVGVSQKQLHFVKFGDEEGMEDRVKTYRTHNPTFWWRAIKLNNATGITTNLGNHLEGLYLKQLDEKLAKPYEGGAEWHAIADHQTKLKELCQKFDHEIDTSKAWWTRVFQDKTEVEEFFKDTFKL